ncbi:hypothetical protein R5R35_012481 [Gryllus longicercus]|uniref:Protein takeout n=1 Tax=Gryllus longicercus TaxID=2509291 RepID=A0AAN9Z1S4_9ORTH
MTLPRALLLPLLLSAALLGLAPAAATPTPTPTRAAAAASTSAAETLSDVQPEDLLNELPVWMNHTCPRSDPNANECLKHTFEGMFPYMANGISEVAIPPFEPLFIKKLSLRRDSGAVTIAGTFFNVLVSGPSNSTADFVKLDESRRRMDFGLTIPELRLEGDYDLRGNILVLPLVGAGKVHMRMSNLTTGSRTRVEIRRVGGREVFHATHMSIDFNVGSLFIHFDNLFGGNKVLGATLNAFMNQHAQTVVADLREPVGEALSDLFIDMMNRLLHRVPLDLWLV